MTECPDALMRDLLPEYAAGVLGEADLQRVTAHVAGCAACQAEIALIGAVRTSFDAAVPVMDVAAIVRALPAPPAHAARPTLSPARAKAQRTWFARHTWQFAAAAGLVLAVMGGMVFSRSKAPVVAQLADSSRTVVQAETTATKASMDEGITFGGGLSDLSLTDLQQLMGQMDSVKTLPSKDPESMTPVIALTEGGKGL